MATPTFLRYLPARLKPLSIPAVWISLGLFGLISIFIWEYHENPQWFEREPVSDVVNSESGLTPDEEAQLAEIDTLDVLLQGSKLPDGSPEVTSIINPNAPGAATTNGNGDGNGNLSGQIDPFRAYTDAYRFPGTRETPLTTGNRPSANSLSGGGVPSAGSALSSNSSNGLQSVRSAPAARSQPATGNALSQALDRQAAEAANANSGSSGSAVGGINSQSSLGGSGSTGNVSGAQSAQSPVAPIPAPYIRTTPEMSPPAGTTGYQVPATSGLPVFNLAPPQPTRNPAPNTTVAPRSADFPSGTLYTAPTSVQPAQPQPAR